MRQAIDEVLEKEIAADPSMGIRRFWAATLYLLTALFTLRVGGQALQRWLPQTWLPPFADWQGSAIGYPVLLAMQLLIIAAMALASHRAWKGTMRPTRAGVLAAYWTGGIYMAASIARPTIGILVPDSHPWFHAAISSAFHLVLASFVLALARYMGLSLAIRDGGAQ